MICIKMKQAREAAGYTVRSLAEKINVSPTIISQWESGKKTPSADNLKKVSEATGISMDVLWENDMRVFDPMNCDISTLSAATLINVATVLASEIVAHHAKIPDDVFVYNLSARYPGLCLRYPAKFYKALAQGVDQSIPLSDDETNALRARLSEIGAEIPNANDSGRTNYPFIVQDVERYFERARIMNVCDK